MVRIPAGSSAKTFGRCRRGRKAASEKAIASTTIASAHVTDPEPLGARGGLQRTEAGGHAPPRVPVETFAVGTAVVDVAALAVAALADAVFCAERRERKPKEEIATMASEIPR